MSAYKRWRAHVKEKGNENVLKPEVWGVKTKEDVIRFLGLDKDDVEWYEIMDLDEEEKVNLNVKEE